jgi:hypothetical protein
MALARAAAFKRAVLHGSPAPLFVGSFASQSSRAMGTKAIVPDMVRKGKAVAAEPQDLLSVLSREISYEKEDGTSAETLKDIAASIPDYSVVGEKPPLCVRAAIIPLAFGFCRLQRPSSIFPDPKVPKHRDPSRLGLLPRAC